MSIPPIVLDAGERLQALADLDAFRFVPPVPLASFLRESKDLDLEVSAPLLEQFEKLDLFRPLFHANYFRWRRKAEVVSDPPGGRRILERIKPGEKWDGPEDVEIVQPSFSHHSLAEWLSAGRIRPSTASFRKPWRRYRKRFEELGSPFFSRFQAFPLCFVLNSSTLRDNLAWYSGIERDDLRRARRMLRARVRAFEICVEGASTARNPRFDCAFLCQAIASRYYFETQGDGRTITVSEQWPPERSWSAYRKKWSAREIAGRLGISASQVAAHHELVMAAAEHHDPLIDWYDLNQFVALEKKRKLKREARLGQLLHCMEAMLRAFYGELAGGKLESPHRNFEVRSSKGEVERPSEASNALRLIANAYHVSPQPKLYIFVEGASEAEVLPLLLSKFWGPLQNLGIEVRDLGGVQGFEGRSGPHSGTLPRLIDELHHLQTLTFVLLDNEGKSPESLQRLRDNLATTPSKLHPERTITRRELVFVWRTSFELENFSDEEIASGLNRLGRTEGRFSSCEIQELRISPRTALSTIQHLFKLRTGRGLSKRALLGTLVESASEDAGSIRRRPIVRLLRELVPLATLNHQPTLDRTAARNQRSGFLGHPIGEKETETTEALMDSLEKLSKEFGVDSLQKAPEEK